MANIFVDHEAQATKLDKMLDSLDPKPESPEEWGQLAMLCIDQMGADLRLQGEILAKLALFLARKSV